MRLTLSKLFSDGIFELDTGENPFHGDGNTSYIHQIEDLTAYSHTLVSNNALASGAIETITTNVAGKGLRVQSQIDWEFLGITEEEAVKFQAKAETLFNNVARSRDIDIMGKMNFYALQGLVYRVSKESGETLALLPLIEDGTHCPVKIKVLEGLHLSTPLDQQTNERVIAGVEVNTHGKITHYHISKHHPYSREHTESLYRLKRNPIGSEYKRIPVKSGLKTNVLHIYDMKRAGQRRGVPYLAPIINTLYKLDRYTEAEIDAAVLNARFSAVIQNENPENGEEPVDKNTKVSIKKGNVVKLPAGWSIKTIDPSRPNQGYDPFFKALVLQICMALNLSFEVFMKQFNSSYTAAQGSIIEGKKMFGIERQNILASQFCQPIYEEYMLRFVLDGKLEAKGFLDDPAIRSAWCRTEWVGDAQEDMNKTRAIEASNKACEYGFSTRDREAKQLNGTDYLRNIMHSKKETEMLEDSGLPYIGTKLDQMQLEKNNNKEEK